MPTVMRVGGLRVAIYPNDHRPAHVHVVGDGHEVVFALDCPNGPPSLRENYGFDRTTVRRIAEFLGDGLATLCERWNEVHGRS